MRVNLSSRGRVPATPRQGQPTPPANDPPRLWPDLTPAQRQHLAQCLAELIRRQRQPTPLVSVEEAPHESR